VVEVELAAMRVEVRSNAPVVLLRAVNGDGRVLPIFIGVPEAVAIASAVQGVKPPRPMSHDLLGDLVTSLGATLERAVVTEVHDDTYYAELWLYRAGHRTRVSSRPSDAIALALRLSTPIYVEDDVFESHSIVISEPEDEEEEPERDPEKLVDEFRNFLREVRPEDFSGPPGGGSS